MKNKSIAAMLAIIFSTAFTLAHAEHHENKNHDSGEMKADVNKDGKVSLEEFTSIRTTKIAERFKHMDANSDGYIDAVEKQSMKDKWAKHKEKRQGTNKL